jgi:hypothetical protein
VEPSKEVVSEPVPGFVAVADLRGLGATLDRVVDDAEMEFLAGDLAVDRRVAKGPLVSGVFQEGPLLERQSRSRQARKSRSGRPRT